MLLCTYCAGGVNPALLSPVEVDARGRRRGLPEKGKGVPEGAPNGVQRLACVSRRIGNSIYSVRNDRPILSSRLRLPLKLEWMSGEEASALPAIGGPPPAPLVTNRLRDVELRRTGTGPKLSRIDWHPATDLHGLCSRPQSGLAGWWYVEELVAA